MLVLPAEHLQKAQSWGSSIKSATSKCRLVAPCQAHGFGYALIKTDKSVPRTSGFRSGRVRREGQTESRLRPALSPTECSSSYFSRRQPGAAGKLSASPAMQERTESFWSKASRGTKLSRYRPNSILHAQTHAMQCIIHTSQSFGVRPRYAGLTAPALSSLGQGQGRGPPQRARVLPGSVGSPKHRNPVRSRPITEKAAYRPFERGINHAGPSAPLLTKCRVLWETNDEVLRARAPSSLLIRNIPRAYGSAQIEAHTHSAV